MVRAGLGGLLLAAVARAPAEDTIIVSGASGQLGGLVVEELLARGVDRPG